MGSEGYDVIIISYKESLC